MAPRLLTLTLWLIALNPAEARSSWLRLQAGPHEILTDCGEKQGRAAAARLAEIRHALPAKSATFPLRLFLFSSEKQYESFRPSPLSNGFYQTGSQRDYIAATCEGGETRRTIAHEYVHYRMNHESVRLPVWIEEGLAEFYSTIAIASKGKLRIGAPVDSHVRLLQSASWLSAAELLDVDKTSPEYNEIGKAGVLYAESWLFVHYLNTDPRYSSGFPALLEQIANRTPAVVALRTVFGKAASALLEEARRAVPRALEKPWDPRYATAASLNAATALEMDLAFADLYRATGHDEAAAKIYSALRKSAEPGAPLETALAAESLSSHDYEGAKRHLDRAIALGGAGADTYFEYAMLQGDTGGDPGEVAALLRRAIAADANHADANFLLGTLSSGEAKVAHLLRATEILPRRSWFWHALATAYHDVGRDEAAQAAAVRALDCAANDHEVSLAKAAIAEHPLTPQFERKEPVRISDRWKRIAGDATAVGTLEAFECGGQSAKLRVRTAEGVLTLQVTDPSKVELRNSTTAARQFTCGPQSDITVAIEYSVATKTVRAIEFR